jgi:hypothetical protein
MEGVNTDRNTQKHGLGSAEHNTLSGQPVTADQTHMTTSFD